MIDLLYPRKRLLLQAAPDHALVACLATLLTVIAALGVAARPRMVWFGVSPVSIGLVVVYVIGIWVVFRHVSEIPGRSESGGGGPAGVAAGPGDLKSAIVRFIAAALTIIGAAPVFAWSAKSIPGLTGFGNTFTGTLLVGFATSLPELVASLAAVRMGAFDLAVGNLFGSNAFNMVVFAMIDPATPGRSIFAAVEESHVLTALAAIGLMGLGLAAIMYRAKRRFALIEPDSWLILAGYLASMAFLYLYSAGG